MKHAGARNSSAALRCRRAVGDGPRFLPAALGAGDACGCDGGVPLMS